MILRSLLLLAVLAVLSVSVLAPPRPAAAGDREFMAKLVAQTFFRALLEGTVETALPLCSKRVNLDGTWVEVPGVLERRLRAMSVHAREQGVRLTRVTVLPHGVVVRRFGPPPARLRGATGPGRLVALARFNTAGAVAVLRRTGAFWKVVAVTD